MKLTKNLLYVGILLSLGAIFGVIISWRPSVEDKRPGNNIVPTKTVVTIVPQNSIVFPENIISKYNINIAKSAILPDKKEIFVAGFISKEINSTPSSYLAVYTKMPEGYKEKFKFAPQFNPNVSYPNPLKLEEFSFISDVQNLSIFTLWNESGSDMAGTHPILISYNTGIFKAVSFYGGNLADNSMIKDLSKTRKDFDVTNYFDSSNTVKTILVQSAKVQENNIELKFIADDVCQSCEHKDVTLKVPLKIE